RAPEDPRFDPSVDQAGDEPSTTVMATPMIAQGATVGAIQVSGKRTGDGVFDQSDRELFEGLAANAAIALRNAQLHTADKRARDLALLLEISREITATLDLDRVLRSVVNLAGRALQFDRGAVALYDKGSCEIRAIAGQEQVDPKDPALQDLAVPAAWAAGRGAPFSLSDAAAPMPPPARARPAGGRGAAGGGEPFYLSDRAAPTTDAERTFLTIFRSDLESDNGGSGLYLPLTDEEGIVGILFFEANAPDFATETQRELATIL